MEWKVPLSDIDLRSEEIEAITDVLTSKWLTMGEVTQRFEAAFAEYLGVKHAFAVANGTAALHIAHQIIGVKEGDEVTFTGPYGEFVLNEDPSVEIICVGGGCGMAPMKNIIHTIYNKWPDRSCWLFFGCRTTQDIFYLEQFEELSKKHPNFHVVYALSDELGPDEKWNGETGFIHLAVDKHLQAGVARQAFLCGPPLMIEAVTRVLEEKGIIPDDIFYDEF